MRKVVGKQVARWALEVRVCALLSSWTLDEEAAQLEENSSPIGPRFSCRSRFVLDSDLVTPSFKRLLAKSIDFR